MTRFVTAGGLRSDYLITHEGKTQLGEVGGNALYATVGASLWQDGVGLWARIGENYPHGWLTRLQKYGLETAGVVTVPGIYDHNTFYAYTPNGRRDDTNPAYHFARIGQPLPAALKEYVNSTPGQDDPHEFVSPLTLRPEDWVTAYNEATAVHLSPLGLKSHLQLVPMLRQKGIRQITVDPGERYMIPERTPFIQALLPHIDAFLPSDQEVGSLFGEEIDLATAAETLCCWGARLVVIKQGANGVWVKEGHNGRLTHLPAFHPPGDPRVIDITGAGDSFCGGFMAGLAQTGDPIQAACMGIVSASFVIEGYGALYARQHYSRQAAQQRLYDYGRSLDWFNLKD